MAEFQEVMRQARRMCKQIPNTCEGCALNSEGYGCLFQNERNPEDKNLNVLADAEKIVMDWAAKHPEPRYPSWKEWWEEKFPNADSLIRPCMFESEEYFGCKNFIGCERCINTPIPADIAEKLGVKPIGGVDDENA